MTTSFLHPETTELSRMINARKNLLLDKPFWGTICLRMKLIEAPNFPALGGTNGKYLKFNPKRTAQCSKSKLRFFIAHEVGHPLYLHHLRRGNRNHRYFNIAGDFVINAVLVADGFELPDDAYYDPRFNGMNVEQVYDIIYKEAIENLAQQKAGKGGVGNKDSEDDEDSEEISDDSDDQDDEGQDNKNDGDQDEEGQDNEGQNDGNQDGDRDQDDEDQSPEPTRDQFGELDDPDPGGTGMVEDWPGPEENPAPPSPSETKHEEQNWKVFTNQALQQAVSFGNIPGGLEREIEKLLTPKVDWNEQLRNFVYKKIKDNYTWKFPNKKYIQGGIYMPSLNGEVIKNLVWVTDSSCSVNAKQIAQSATELTGILETFNIMLHALSCDTEVHTHQIFTSQDLPVQLDVRGFGGTDFRPPFKWVEENLDELPICLVYITDLQCDQFPDIPEYPVLWICTGRKEYIWPYDEPPFGDVVYVEM